MFLYNLICLTWNISENILQLQSYRSVSDMSKLPTAIFTTYSSFDKINRSWKNIKPSETDFYA